MTTLLPIVSAQQASTDDPAAAPAPSTPASPQVYGKSVEGRDLVAYTFGNGPNVTIIQASIHGNERNTRPLAEKLIAYLNTHPDDYGGCTVYVLPCINPDGWAHSTRTNVHGVDLNRNFPVGWHSNVPGKLNRGSGPLSESESAALVKFVLAHPPAKIVSIHNPLHMLDYSGALGKRLANVIAAHDHYPVPSGGVGYPTPGSFGQFCEAHKIAVVTLELPRESVDSAWDQNQAALLAAIKADIGTSGESR